MRLQVSRTMSIAMGQLVLNIFLVSWLYDEYVHNPFMQQYLAGLWTSTPVVISIASIVAGVIATGSYLTVWRRSAPRVSPEPSRDLKTNASSPIGLTTLDVCPVCIGPLKALSENRFQCRKCRRYFRR